MIRTLVQIKLIIHANCHFAAKIYIIIYVGWLLICIVLWIAKTNRSCRMVLHITSVISFTSPRGGESRNFCFNHHRSLQYCFHPCTLFLTFPKIHRIPIVTTLCSLPLDKHSQSHIRLIHLSYCWCCLHGSLAFLSWSSSLTCGPMSIPHHCSLTTCTQFGDPIFIFDLLHKKICKQKPTSATASIPQTDRCAIRSWLNDANPSPMRGPDNLFQTDTVKHNRWGTGFLTRRW